MKKLAATFCCLLAASAFASAASIIFVKESVPGKGGPPAWCVIEEDYQTNVVEVSYQSIKTGGTYEKEIFLTKGKVAFVCFSKDVTKPQIISEQPGGT